MMLASEGAYTPAPHLWLLNQYALALAGRRIRRLIVQMPPRHGKSTFLDQFFTSWWLGRFPDERVILCSAVAQRAAEWGAASRNALVEHGEPVFGARVARSYSAASERWEVEAHLGSMLTAGIGGPITGRGADLFIIDDPLKNAEEADSALIRQRQWDWLTSTALSRLEPDGVMVIIMARWHEADLAGRCLSEFGNEWTLLNLPALAEPNDPLGRPEGAALWPARYSETALAHIQSYSERWWNALYRGQPAPPGGAIFKLAWWESADRRYDPDALALPDAVRVVGRWLFLDTAFKKGEENDSTACSVVELLTDYRLRWRDLWVERLEFPDLLARIGETARIWNADGLLAEVVIEDKGSGTSALQSLRHGAAGDPALARKFVSFLPQGSKEYRARQAAQWCARGAVLLPHPRPSVPWLYDLEQHLRDYPRTAHDDDVDTVSMAILYLENYLARWAAGRAAPDPLAVATPPLPRPWTPRRR